MLNYIHFYFCTKKKENKKNKKKKKFNQKQNKVLIIFTRPYNFVFKTKTWIHYKAAGGDRV